VTPWRFPEKRNPLDPPEGSSISSIDLASAFDEDVQARQLCTADRSEEIAEPVVVTDLFVLIVRRGLSCL